MLGGAARKLRRRNPSHEHPCFQMCFLRSVDIPVKGLDWCLNKPKEVRIETLTAKILCKDHKPPALSERDSEKKLVARSDTIREFARTKTETGKNALHQLGVQTAND